MRHTCECVTHVNVSHMWIYHAYECITYVIASHVWKRHTCESIIHVKGSHMWRRHTCECVTHVNAFTCEGGNTYEVFTCEYVSREGVTQMKASHANMSNTKVSYIRFSHMKASHVILSHIKASHVVLSHAYDVTWLWRHMKKASHEEWRHTKKASHEEWHCMKNGIAWRMASHEEGVTPLHFRSCLTRSIRVCDAFAINLTTSLSEWQWRKQSPKKHLEESATCTEV
jgi:hypothetical protein